MIRSTTAAFRRARNINTTATSTASSASNLPLPRAYNPHIYRILRSFFNHECKFNHMYSIGKRRLRSYLTVNAGSTRSFAWRNKNQYLKDATVKRGDSTRTAMPMNVNVGNIHCKAHNGHSCSYIHMGRMPRSQSQYRNQNHNYMYLQKRDYIFFEDGGLVSKFLKDVLQSMRSVLGLQVQRDVRHPTEKIRNKPIIVTLLSTRERMMDHLKKRFRFRFRSPHNSSTSSSFQKWKYRRLKSFTSGVRRRQAKLRSYYAHRKSSLTQKSHKLLTKWRLYNQRPHPLSHPNSYTHLYPRTSTLQRFLAHIRHHPKLRFHPHLNHNHNHDRHKYFTHLYRQMKENARAHKLMARFKSITHWDTLLHKGAYAYIRQNLRHNSKNVMQPQLLTPQRPSPSSTIPIDSTPIQHHAITIHEPFRKEWFSTVGGYPLTSKDPITGRFCNPWNSQSTNGLKPLAKIWHWKKTRLSMTESFLDPPPALDDPTFEWNANLYDQEQRQRQRVEALMSPPNDEMQLTWIGHATNLLQIGKEFTILTDPVFSHKASPFQILNDFEFLGVPRFIPPSLTIEDLSTTLKGQLHCGIDVCVISHDHYDHLDWNSVQCMQDENLVQFWAVPMGMKDWFLKNINGIREDQIVEMEWWDSITFVKGSGNGSTSLKIQNGISNIVKTNQVQGEHHDIQNRSNTSFNTTTDTTETNNVTHRPPSKDSSKHDDTFSELTLTCAPAQHWSSRTPFDRNKRLWCSWAMHSKLLLQEEKEPPNSSDYPNHNGNGNVNEFSSNVKTKHLSFYFAGDTGYPEKFPLHRQIGDVLGPFDLASIPIGAYKPRFFMQDSHCDPHEAVKIHQDVRSRRSVAIHWGTFPLANESFEEPPTLLLQAAKRAQEDFRAIPHGDQIRSDSYPSSLSSASSLSSKPKVF